MTSESEVGKIILAVMTNAMTPEQDAEFNDWYTNTHVPDVLKVPGFVAATRFCLLDKQLLDEVELPKQRYFAIYELDTADVDAASAGLQAAIESGSMFVSDTLDPSTVAAHFYQQITARQKAI
jgi:hypothetical protein